MSLDLGLGGELDKMWFVFYYTNDVKFVTLPTYSIDRIRNNTMNLTRCHLVTVEENKMFHITHHRDKNNGVVM